MIQIQHANFGWLHSPPLPPACCHCLIIRHDDRLLLIDTGIGMHDIREPLRRVGKAAIEAAGFQFRAETTAIHQIRNMGLTADSVTDIVLTHADPDHAGGMADFPEAKVHLSVEEKIELDKHSLRYNTAQFEHQPKWATYANNDSEFFGLPARRVTTSLPIDVFLVPLPGHTLGHCGVGIRSDGSSWLHVGDAYYLRVELAAEPHPIDGLSTARAENDEMRQVSLKLLQELAGRCGSELEMFGYHDASELPIGIPRLDELDSTSTT